MSLSELLKTEEPAWKIQGVTIAIVTNNKDPEGLGRVKVKLPYFSETIESDWSRIVSFMGGKDRGAFFLPEVDDEVLVAFEHSNANSALYVLGSLWNGQDKPPIKNEDGKNDIRMIKTRSGHTIELNDKEGEESITIMDKSEKNGITIKTKDNKMIIQADKDIEINAANGKISMKSKELEIQTTGGVAKIDAKADMNIKASGNVNVKGTVINLN